MVLDGEHVKSAVSKNLSFARLALELLQTVNGDMCKVSENGFSRMFAALVVLIQLGVGTLRGGVGVSVQERAAMAIGKESQGKSALCKLTS